MSTEMNWSKERLDNGGHGEKKRWEVKSALKRYTSAFALGV